MHSNSNFCESTFIRSLGISFQVCVIVTQSSTFVTGSRHQMIHIHINLKVQAKQLLNDIEFACITLRYICTTKSLVSVSIKIKIQFRRRGWIHFHFHMYHSHMIHNTLHLLRMHIHHSHTPRPVPDRKSILCLLRSYFRSL